MISKVSVLIASLLMPIALYASSDIIQYDGDYAESLFRNLSTIGAEVKDSCAGLNPAQGVSVCVIEEARVQGDMACSRFEDVRVSYTESKMEPGHWYMTGKQIKVTYLCKLLLH